MFKGEYKWQHDYVRLVSDTGFCFERHKNDYFDKNKISSIDIDRIIEDRDFAAIERIIPSLTKFVLDPEQAQILDDAFVKVFLLNQLSIQYLLYCKKYLDNTLVIIKEENKKVKEDNKELNLFVDDLQGHITKLMKELDEKPIFKCTQCNKIFSTEEFLSSHMKRRHSTPVKEAETDQLQMEIKELKGRLNNAEKMIHKEQHEIDVHITKDVELKKIEDLQQKFEDLRLQVQSELKILQTQHNYQEKYEKLFEKMTLQGRGEAEDKKSLHKRRESTTQTELEEEGTNVKKKDKENDKENIPEISDTQKQMTEFGEAIESKVTSSLQKIENQMQSFWSKLNDMEKLRKNDGEELEKKPKPMLRSRSKFTMKSVDLDSEETVEEPVKKPAKEEIDAIDHSAKIEEQKVAKISKNSQVRISTTPVKKNSPQVPPLERQSVSIEESDTTTSETIASESEISAESEEDSIKVVKPLPIPRKRQQPRKNDEKIVMDEELLKHFRAEVEKIIMGRLQDLGVSPDWKGLPTRSFQRALEIVNHQANLIKKSHPKFDFISSQIEKTVTKKIEETNKKSKQPETQSIKAKVKKVEVKKSPKGKAPSPFVEIKNRKMYETDSDSEIRPPQIKDNLKRISAPYSAVIEELKTVTSKIDSSDKSDLPEAPVKNEEQTKGVLKSYPSVGSLTKKKVIFNLSDDDEIADKKDNKDGGSTTSIASSVLDGTPTPRKDDKKKVKEKDIEDLSDFDFSDM